MKMNQQQESLTVDEAVNKAAEALALAYDLDGNCMQRVVFEAMKIWKERYDNKEKQPTTKNTLDF